MIPQKYTALVFSFFMALLMSCIMSLVISLFNMGFSENILQIWIKAWAFSFAVAFPAVLIVAPVAKKLTALLIHQNQNQHTHNKPASTN